MHAQWELNADISQVPLQGLYLIRIWILIKIASSARKINSNLRQVTIRLKYESQCAR